MLRFGLLPVFFLSVFTKGMVANSLPETPPVKPSISFKSFEPGGDHWTRDGNWLFFDCDAASTSSDDTKWASLYLNGIRIMQETESSHTASFRGYTSSFRDSGNYTCTFTNSKGESPHSDSYRLSVVAYTPRAPKVVIGNEDDVNHHTNFIRGMTTYGVSCKSTDISGWDENCVLYFNGQRYAFDKYCEFTVTHTESGNFTCTMSSSTATGPMSPPKMVTYLDRPIIRPSTSNAPKLAQPYSLVCNASNDSSITMSWYIGTENNKTLLENATSGTLEFDALGTEDEQIYYCKITQGINEAWSEPFPLYFSKRAKPHLSRSEEENAPDRNSTKFHCVSDVFGIYHLYKDGVKMASKYGANQTFVVFSSKSSDAGKFTCTVSSEEVESEHSNIQFINSKDLKLTASHDKAEVGGSLSLTCMSKSNLEGTRYSWTIYRSDGTVSRSRLGQTLTLNPVSKADAGIYTCETEVNGIPMTSLAPLYYYHVVFDPPSPATMFEVGFVHHQYDNAFEPVFSELGLKDYDQNDDDHHYYVISCVCKGYLCDPNYGFRLYKNNKEVSYIKHTDSIRFTESSWNMTRFYTFDVTKSKNDGEYTCTALNAVGESKPSSSIRISTTRVLPSPTVTADHPDALIGQSITLTCNVPSMIPDADIKWRKNFHDLLRSGRKLHLPNLTTVDHGNYDCSYRNPGLRNEFYRYPNDIRLGHQTYEPFELNINEAQQVTLEPYIYPKENEEDSEQYYIYAEGQRIMYWCYDPFVFAPEDITYYLNGNLIGTTSTSGFTLPTIDIGVYNLTCASRNRISQSVMSYPSVVRVEARPTISASTDSPTLGHDLTLTCNVQHASDGYDVIWRKNEKVLPETSTRLTLAKISECDRGVYQCRQKVGAWYQALSEEYHLAFGKIAKPEILTYHGKDVNGTMTILNPGSSLTLYCLTASLLPILPLNSTKVMFYRDGDAIATGYHWFIEEIDDTLCQFRLSHTMYSVSTSDSGKYTCVMESTLGVSETSDALTIKIGDGTDGANFAVSVYKSIHTIVLHTVLASVVINLL